MRVLTLGFFAILAVCGCSKKATFEGTPQSVTTLGEGQPTASKPAVVFLGDSLTAGRGLSEGEALPALIRGKIEEAGLEYRVIDAGRSGDTTAGGLARVDWYLRDTVDAEVLVIGLGSNDAMRGLGLASIEANLRKIVERARRQRPGIRILLWELRTFPNMGPEYGQAYNDIFKRVAGDLQVGLLPFPLDGVAGNPDLNTDDGIHPNAAGSRIMANNIWAGLRPVL